MGLSCFWVPISRIKFGSRYVKMVPLLQRRSNLWFSMPGDFHARKGSNFVAALHPKRPSTQCSRLLIWCKRRTYDGFMILIEIGSDFGIHVDPARKAATSRAWGPCRIIESQLKTTMNIVYECYIDVVPFGQGWFPASYGCLLDCNTRVLTFNTPRWKWTRHGA